MHLIDLHRISDINGPNGTVAAVSHKAPDQPYRTLPFKCDLDAQIAAMEMRDSLIVANQEVRVRNLL